MHINESAGIFYDMIYYNLIYFNRKSIDLRYQSFYYDREAFFENYDTLRRARNHLAPPPELFPFFCFYNDKACAMSMFFQDTFDFFHDTIDSFLAKLSNKASFKQFFFTYYLSDFQEQLSIDGVLRRDGESIGKALALLSKRIDIEQFTYMFYHYNEVINKLVTYLNQLKPYIEGFHSGYRNKGQVIQDFISEDNQVMVRRCRPDKMEGHHFESQTYSVSLLNKYLIIRQASADKSKYAFLLGYDCCSMLPQIVDYSTSSLSASTVMESLGHRVKLEILTNLREKDMTVSQLGRSLNLARTSISRYIDDLYAELAILKIRKKGPEIYYRINPMYLRSAKFIINDYLDQFILDVETKYGNFL